jgi:hypothetical protein
MYTHSTMMMMMTGPGNPAPRNFFVVVVFYLKREIPLKVNLSLYIALPPIVLHLPQLQRVQ